MTTSLRKNYNRMALRGAGVDDMEIIEQHNNDPVAVKLWGPFDPSIAYTRKLPEAQAEKIRDWNYNHYLKDGMKEAEAKAKADSIFNDDMKDLKVLLAKNGMLK